MLYITSRKVLLAVTLPIPGLTYRQGPERLLSLRQGAAWPAFRWWKGAHASEYREHAEMGRDPGDVVSGVWWPWSRGE
jgi:hypothetical protein